MSSAPTPAAPALSIENISKVFAKPVRLRILLELGKGEPLPATVLSRTLGISAGGAAKHLNLMRRCGALARGHGRLYTIAPAWRPAPGTALLDFGLCLMRLDETPA